MKKILLAGLLTATSLLALTNNDIVAKLNGKPIYAKEVNLYIQALSGNKDMTLDKIPQKARKEIIQQYLDTVILYNKAKNIENRPDFKMLVRKLAVEKYLQEKLSNIKVTDKEIEDFYNQNKDIYFKTNPQYKARHILVKDKKIAEEIINQLKGLKGKELEEKFSELAKKYSTGPTKIKGGELGWFDPKQMVPEFSNALKNLKEGEFTLQPVKTRFGYHVILLEGVKKKAYIPLNKVKPQIVEYLKRVKLQKELQKIREKNQIEINM